MASPRRNGTGPCLGESGLVAAGRLARIRLDMSHPTLPLLASVFISLAAGYAQDAPSSPTPAASPAPAVETIVFIRHGEKPADDKGQLDCQGLNRALALPRVLIAKFGKADQIFAPLTLTRTSHGKSYSYVRPLMTIEPTAITLALPVDTRFPFDAIDALQTELLAPADRSALIFVAWEHSELVELVRHLLGALGDVSDQVPDWPSNDYDRIYVVKITSEGDTRTASFREDHEMLDGLSADYPIVNAPAAKAP